MFDFDAISQDADRRFADHQRGGVRGQVVRPQDGAEYWYALVAHERAGSALHAAADALMNASYAVRTSDGPSVSVLEDAANTARLAAR